MILIAVMSIYVSEGWREPELIGQVTGLPWTHPICGDGENVFISVVRDGQTKFYFYLYSVKDTMWEKITEIYPYTNAIFPSLYYDDDTDIIYFGGESHQIDKPSPLFFLFSKNRGTYWRDPEDPGTSVWWSGLSLIKFRDTLHGFYEKETFSIVEKLFTGEVWGGEETLCTNAIYPSTCKYGDEKLYISYDDNVEQKIVVKEKGEDSEWKEVFSFSGGMKYYFPSIRSDADGNIHLVFTNKNKDTTEVNLYYTKYNREKDLWEEPIKLCNFEAYYNFRRDCDLGVDEYGNIYVVWNMSRDDDVDQEIFIKRYDGYNKRWLDAVQITDSSLMSLDPSIYIDKYANIHLIFSEYLGGMVWHAYYTNYYINNIGIEEITSSENLSEYIPSVLLKNKALLKDTALAFFEIQKDNETLYKDSTTVILEPEEEKEIFFRQWNNPGYKEFTTKTYITNNPQDVYGGDDTLTLDIGGVNEIKRKNQITIKRIQGNSYLIFTPQKGEMYSLLGTMEMKIKEGKNRITVAKGIHFIICDIDGNGIIENNERVKIVVVE